MGWRRNHDWMEELQLEEEDVMENCRWRRRNSDGMEELQLEEEESRWRTSRWEEEIEEE